MQNNNNNNNNKKLHKQLTQLSNILQAHKEELIIKLDEGVLGAALPSYLEYLEVLKTLHIDAKSRIILYFYYYIFLILFICLFLCFSSLFCIYIYLFIFFSFIFYIFLLFSFPFSIFLFPFFFFFGIWLWQVFTHSPATTIMMAMLTIPLIMKLRT